MAGGVYIGITGNNTERKKELVHCLESKGYPIFSLQEELEKEVAISIKEASPEDISRTYAHLTGTYGLDFLARKAVRRFVKGNFYELRNYDISNLVATSKMRATIAEPVGIIDGINNIAECKTLKQGLQRDLYRSGIDVARVFYLVGLEENNTEAAASVNYVLKKETTVEIAVEDIFKKAKQYRQDVYYMLQAINVSSRSDCIRRLLGAVIVKGDKMIASGYNGVPPGLKNCNEGGCKRCHSDVPSGDYSKVCRCVHAEANAILQGARNGVAVAGATLYTMASPCTECTKTIIAVGLDRVVYGDAYAHEEESMQMFHEAGTIVDRLEL